MKPNKRATILTLLERGKSQREIARLTGIDRKTVKGYRERWLAERANSPGVATGSEAAVATPGQQTPPPWPPAGVPVATSRCEPHSDFIEAQVRLGRNGVAIYQDLVDQHGFAGAYNSVKRFVGKLRLKGPERFDRLSFQPGEEMQVDYGEGAPTRVPGTDRYRKPRLFVATLRSRGAASGAWSGSPASRCGPSCTSRPGATSAARVATWCWTTSRKACSSPTCTSPNSTRCLPPRWRTTRWWPIRPGSGTRTARAAWKVPSATPRPRP